MGRGDGNRVGWCPVASDAIGCNKGRDMHSMDSACRSTLGVPDAAMRELQRVPSASGRGTWEHKHWRHLVSCVWIQGVNSSVRKGEKAAQVGAEEGNYRQVPWPLLFSCNWLWGISHDKLHACRAMPEGTVSYWVERHQFAPQLRQEDGALIQWRNTEWALSKYQCECQVGIVGVKLTWAGSNTS